MTAFARNTLPLRPSMCVGCHLTAPVFAAQNPSFDIVIFHGSDGTRL